MSRHPFDLLMELPSSEVRLDCAALHLARDNYPGLEVARYLARLDDLARQVSARHSPASAAARHQALREVLVEENGYRGECDQHDHPSASFLNCVLDRGCGLPILLGAIWIEVGRRLCWSVAGVNFPGHFLVRIEAADGVVIADPYFDGRCMTSSSLRELHKQYVAAGEPGPENLAPADTRTILSRILRNIQRYYLDRADLPRLQWALERLVAVEPQNVQHLQDLAAVHLRRGDLQAACRCLRTCVRLQPDSPDAPLLRGNLARLEAAILARN